MPISQEEFDARLRTEDSGGYGYFREESEALADRFVNVFNRIGYLVHETAKTKGWWDTERNDGEAIALMHSELSEGLEALRKNLESDHIVGFDGIEEELADVIIRIMDLAQARRWKVAEALIGKIEFNFNRERKHGGKRF